MRTWLVLPLTMAFSACGVDAGAPEGLPVDAAPATAMQMSVPNYILKGTAFQVTVAGAPAGRDVYLVASVATAGAPVCPPALAPDCLRLLAPTHTLGTSRANAQGQATFRVNIPNLALIPILVNLQAATRGPAGAYISQLETINALNPTGDDDGDGVNNQTELSSGGNPFDGDSDNDLLNDAAELAAGTDLDNPDTDGGGATDGAEVTAGTDPLDPADDAPPVGNGGLMIVEVVDHLSQPAARYIELYNSSSSAILLDGWRVERYSNAGTVSAPLSLTAGATVAPGASWVLASSSTFDTVFGVPASQYNSGANANGDDAYTLTSNGNIVDIYGVIGVAPVVGADWNFLDSVVKRNANVTGPNPTFNLGEWTITAGDADANPFNRN